LDCSRFAATFGFRARPWTEEADAITVAVAQAWQSEPTHAA
jgi:hypothetical protein